MAASSNLKFHPKLVVAHPVLLLLSLLLCFVGIGFVLLFLLWLSNRATTLTVTPELTRLRKGLLSKRVTEVWHEDVRNVSVLQSVTDRLNNAGTIEISSAGQGGIEISARAMPNPYKIKDLIDGYRRTNRRTS